MLPKLPKFKNQKEADITPHVLAWFLEYYNGSPLIEIKIKGNKLLPHQKKALYEANNGGFAFKLPDMGRKMPADAFIAREGFLVVCEERNCEAYKDDKKQFTFHV